MHLQTRETPCKSKAKAKERKVSEDSTLSKQEKTSKCKRKKKRCQGEDEMANKDAKQNEKKKRKKERTASYHHHVVPAGTDVINADGNVNDNGNAKEDVVEEHAVAATELVEEGSITDKDGNVTSLEGMPVLHTPPPVNSKRKHNQAYESFNEKWNRLFMDLVEYKEKNGHCDILTTSGSLGRWISTQRLLFRSNKLKEDRYEKLVGIGFVFEPRSDLWNTQFMELVKYKEENGHCNIPTTHGLLGGWILNQRILFRSKKLKADCHEKLVGIGFLFEDVRLVSEHEKWNRCFMELVEYKKKNGHCNIIVRTNGSLGSWIRYQRLLFRSKELRADRYEKLVGIGFVHEDVKVAFEDEKWNRHFIELVKYKEKNGHCKIAQTNRSLGNWIGRQRLLFRSKKLKADRYEKLVEIGLTFGDVTALEFKGKVDQQWQDMYQELLEQKETKGHCFDVPRTLPLGRWLSRQRRLSRNGNLREDRVEKLLSVGFVFKMGEAVGVRDASSGQPPKKKRIVEDLDKNLAAITHDEGEKGIDNANTDGDVNDNGYAHEDVVEEHTVAATEQEEKGIKEKNSLGEIAPPLEENNEVHKDGPAVSV